MVLCDIGNTTFHFMLNGRDLKIGVNEQKENFPQINQTIYFVSVNENGTNRLKEIYTDISDLSTKLNFKTNYKGMGIDRQVVCSGYKNAIIVDAGSAITVDVIKNSKHKGGYILPGVFAYSKIYPNISSKLAFEYNYDINLDKMPLNTNDAINFAIFNSILQPIQNLQKKYSVPLVFTGGDGKILYKLVGNYPKKYKKELMFKVMKKILKEKGIEC
ncbi:MAG: type III pantothenate kinase [Campylobacterales bacterium]|nr:type III pantothenate kinase [Campylobacterales bacterium]